MKQSRQLQQMSKIRSTSPRRSAGSQKRGSFTLSPIASAIESPCPRRLGLRSPDLSLAWKDRGVANARTSTAATLCRCRKTEQHLAGHVSQQATSHYFVDLWHFVSCPSGIYVALASGNSSPFPKCGNWHCFCFSLALSGSSETGVRWPRGGQGYGTWQDSYPADRFPQLDVRGAAHACGLEQAFSDLLSGCPAIRADAEAYFLAYGADSSAFSLDAICAQFHLSSSAIRGEVRRRLKQRPLGRGKQLRQAA